MSWIQIVSLSGIPDLFDTPNRRLAYDENGLMKMGLLFTAEKNEDGLLARRATLFDIDGGGISHKLNVSLFTTRISSRLRSELKKKMDLYLWWILLLTQSKITSWGFSAQKYHDAVMSSAKNCAKISIALLLAVNITLLRCSWHTLMKKLHIDKKYTFISSCYSIVC